MEVRPDMQGGATHFTAWRYPLLGAYRKAKAQD
jgi:hypothetical protein